MGGHAFLCAARPQWKIDGGQDRELGPGQVQQLPIEESAGGTTATDKRSAGPVPASLVTQPEWPVVSAWR